jgi:hypothetical protein
MAGKLDKARVHFLRTVAGDQWEHWVFAENKQAQFVRRLNSPSEVHHQMVVSLPARCTLTFPAWLMTNDRGVIPEMLRLQLEKRGLIGRNGGNSSADYRVVESGENRTLAIATILQPDFPKELALEKVQRYEPSAYTFPLPADRLVLWRERGRLTVAATRGREPVAVQVLGDSTLSDTAAIELKCIAFELESRRLCERLLGITLWGDFTGEEGERLEQYIGLKVTRESVPPPSLPNVKSKLLPPEVCSLHEKRRRRARIAAAVAWLAAAYVVGVVGLIGYIFWQHYEADELRRVIEEQGPTVAAIQETADRWRRLELAVDPKVYPVEILYQIAGVLPHDGLRLTGLEIQNGKVLVHGEASTAPAAFKFSEDIKAKLELRMFTWRMPSPTLRPDGRAAFTIEGEPKIESIN